MNTKTRTLALNLLALAAVALSPLEALASTTPKGPSAYQQKIQQLELQNSALVLSLRHSKVSLEIEPPPQLKSKWQRQQQRVLAQN